MSKNRAARHTISWSKPSKQSKSIDHPSSTTEERTLQSSAEQHMGAEIAKCSNVLQDFNVIKSRPFSKPNRNPQNKPDSSSKTLSKETKFAKQNKDKQTKLSHPQPTRKTSGRGPKTKHATTNLFPTQRQGKENDTEMQPPNTKELGKLR